MLLFLVSFFSFILFSKSISVKHLLPYASEMRLLSLWFFSKELLFLLVSWLMKRKLNFTLSHVSRAMSIKKRSVSSKVENVEESDVMTVLDLPELALDKILGLLPPSGLCNTTGVCSSLRDKCRSDYLWEKHMKNKWGRVIGQAAYQEWQWQFASRKDFNLDGNLKKGLIRSLSLICWIPANLNNSNKLESFMPANTIMSWCWYLSLESGKFWFPAQVYNRELDRCVIFSSRYPPHGRPTIVVEEGVQWDRLRAPPVETPPHNLHVSDCLNDLHPGDHIEIQWRRSKEFPYGWWYRTVGHLESCDGNKNYCHCHNSDTVALGFNQYALGSRWRRTVVNRKDHWEEGNKFDGFYGGIRKLYNTEEIAVWKRL